MGNLVAKRKNVKPKPIAEWGLSAVAQAKVRKELEAWLTLFIEHADGQQGNVYEADFINNRFFYFTSCQDLMGDKPESTSMEQDANIRRRKQHVMLQLFVKNLLGELTIIRSQCSHCGHKYMRMLAFNGGTASYCDKCELISLLTFTNEITTTLPERIKKALGK